MIAPRNRLLVAVGAIAGGAALLAAIVPGFAIPAIAIALALAAIAAADGIAAARGLAGVSIQTLPMLRTVRDRETELLFSVVNRGPEVRSLQAALALPEPFHTTAATLEGGPRLGRDQRFDLHAEFSSARRGEFHIARCWIRAESKLGLWSARKAAPMDLTVRVYPNLRTDETAAEFLKRGTSGSRLVRMTGKGREFEKLRDYAHGDSFDEVDWKATARRGKPVVRVFQVERTQEIYVAIDASRLSGRPLGAYSTLEHYVSASLVMGLAAEAQGDRFGLITFSDRLHKFVPARGGKQHYTTCRDAIYRLEPRLVEPDFGELFSFLETRLTKRALVVILTALDDPLIGETFARHVSIASRRHLVIAAMIRPEGANPLFESAARDVDDIYGHLAGHLRWRGLMELTGECRRKGVRLHLLNPEKLSGQLTSIYLDVKRRQQL